MSNKKQNSRFAITEITNQDFSKFLNKFKNSPYLVYKSKQVYNEPTEAWLFLIKQITKLMKIKRHIWPNFVKVSINKQVVHVEKVIKYEELEINSRRTRCADKYNKLQVHVIIRVKKRLRAHLKRKKGKTMVVFVYMNMVKNYALKPLNASAQHRKRPSVR